MKRLSEQANAEFVRRMDEAESSPASQPEGTPRITSSVPSPDGSEISEGDNNTDRLLPSQALRPSSPPSSAEPPVQPAGARGSHEQINEAMRHLKEWANRQVNSFDAWWNNPEHHHLSAYLPHVIAKEAFEAGAASERAQADAVILKMADRIESLRTELAEAKKWQRQQACSECDGDGCPQCCPGCDKNLIEIERLELSLAQMREALPNVNAIIRVATGELDRGTPEQRLEYIAETARIVAALLSKEKA